MYLLRGSVRLITPAIWECMAPGLLVRVCWFLVYKYPSTACLRLPSGNQLLCGSPNNLLKPVNDWYEPVPALARFSFKAHSSEGVENWDVRGKGKMKSGRTAKPIYRRVQANVIYCDGKAEEVSQL